MTRGCLTSEPSVDGTHGSLLREHRTGNRKSWQQTLEFSFVRRDWSIDASFAYIATCVFLLVSLKKKHAPQICSKRAYFFWHIWQEFSTSNSCVSSSSFGTTRSGPENPTLETNLHVKHWTQSHWGFGNVKHWSGAGKMQRKRKPFSWIWAMRMECCCAHPHLSVWQSNILST